MKKPEWVEKLEEWQCMNRWEKGLRKRRGADEVSQRVSHG